MLWLYVVIFAYLLFALANIGDKVVVSKYKTQPIAYAFYVGILGITSVILIPLGVKWASSYVFSLSFLAGATFVMAAYFMYQADKQGEISRAITILGSSSPIFTFILAILFLKEKLALNQLFAFSILVLAIILLSWQHNKKANLNLKLLFWALMAGFFYSLNYILTKYLFAFGNYLTIFFWTRIGGVLTALIIVLIPSARKLIKADFKKPKEKRGILVLGIQIAGGAGVMAQSYALKLASATLVNALQAIQYAGVFILALILGKKMPSLRENLNKKQIGQKIIAILLVALGLYLITLK